MVEDGPTNKQRNKHVIITSKRRFDVTMTCLLCFVHAWNFTHIVQCYLTDRDIAPLPVKQLEWYEQIDLMDPLRTDT